MMIDQRERIEEMNEFKRSLSGPARTAFELTILAGAVAAQSKLEEKLGRELTTSEHEWIADGWVPASVKVEL